MINNCPSGAQISIEILQGASFAQEYQLFTDDAQTIHLDLSGCTIDSEIRARASDTDALVEFTVTINADPTTGKFILSLTPDQTSDLPTDASTQPEPTISEYCYDVKITRLDASVIRPISGVVFVSPQVTHE